MVRKKQKQIHLMEHERQRRGNAKTHSKNKPVNETNLSQKKRDAKIAETIIQRNENHFKAESKFKTFIRKKPKRKSKPIVKRLSYKSSIRCN